MYSTNPHGYRQSPNFPVLQGGGGGRNHCPDCLCYPCIIVLPPDFLRGPHPTNAEKWHRLYRMFWKVLKDLGVWCDEEYLRRKQDRTVWDDKRAPLCHSSKFIISSVYNIIYTGSETSLSQS